MIQRLRKIISFQNLVSWRPESPVPTKSVAKLPLKERFTFKMPNNPNYIAKVIFLDVLVQCLESILSSFHGFVFKVPWDTSMFWGNEMPVLLMNKFVGQLWLVVNLNVYSMIYHLISQLAILQESKPFSFLCDPSAPHPSERIFLGAVLNQGLCTFGW